MEDFGSFFFLSFSHSVTGRAPIRGRWGLPESPASSPTIHSFTVLFLYSNLSSLGLCLCPSWWIRTGGLRSLILGKVRLSVRKLSTIYGICTDKHQNWLIITRKGRLVTNADAGISKLGKWRRSGPARIHPTTAFR